MSSSCRLYNNHVKVTGNHVVYDCGAWFLRIIMSSSLTLFCLSSVKKHKHEFFFCFIQFIIKQLLDSVFCDIRIIKVSVRVISLGLRLCLWLITPTSSLIILDITKTSSNSATLTLSPSVFIYFTAGRFWSNYRMQGHFGPPVLHV